MKKKNIILTIIFIAFLALFIVLFGITYKTVKNYSLSEKCLNSALKFQEYNAETIFSIDKITYFSSADANIETNSNSSFKISNLLQYTDIAISIKPNSESLTSKNTLKSVLLSDIEYSLKPSIGKPQLYYKNINNFATSKFSKENLIEGSINFSTTSESKIDYSEPILYNNCANPITLCYVNSNMQNEYTLDSYVSNISHNGSLLKSCRITLNSISCKLSFIITITNNLNENYECPLTLNIPLSTDSSTIYDGNLILKENVDYKFIRID